MDDARKEYHDRSMAVARGMWLLCKIRTPTMSTIGKRYIDRTGDRNSDRVLDARTKAILNSVMKEGRGRALDAYLRALMPAT